MSDSIYVGKLDNDNMCHFPYSFDQTEPDGTSREHNLTAGWPVRGLYDVTDWVKTCPVMAAIYKNIRQAPNRAVPLTPDLMRQIQALPKKPGRPGDRTQWLKYWTARAVQEYGQDAVIAIYE